MTLDFENTKISSDNSAGADTSAASNFSGGASQLQAPVGMEAMIPEFTKLARHLVLANYLEREDVHQHFMTKFGIKRGHATNIVAKIMLHGHSIIHKLTGERLTYAIELADMARLEFEDAYEKQLAALNQRPLSELLAPLGMESLIKDFSWLARELVVRGHVKRAAVTRAIADKKQIKFHKAENSMSAFLLRRTGVIDKRGEIDPFFVGLAELAEADAKNIFAKEYEAAEEIRERVRSRGEKPNSKKPEDPGAEPKTPSGKRRKKRGIFPPMPYVAKGFVLAREEFARENLGPLLAAYALKSPMILTDTDVSEELAKETDIDVEKYQASIIPFFSGECSIIIQSKRGPIRYTGLAKVLAKIGGLTYREAYRDLFRNLSNKPPQGMTYKC